MKKNEKLKKRVKTSLIQPEKRSCRNCLKGKLLCINSDVLCLEKGIVSADYCCSSHRFNVMEDLQKADFYRCSDCEHFIFYPHDSIPYYGLCGMFSVRKCDGSNKKACSKFVRRRGEIA